MVGVLQTMVGAMGETIILRVTTADSDEYGRPDAQSRADTTTRALVDRQGGLQAFGFGSPMVGLGLDGSITVSVASGVYKAIIAGADRNQIAVIVSETGTNPATDGIEYRIESDEPHDAGRMRVLRCRKR